MTAGQPTGPDGHRVATKPTKAIIGAVLAFLGGIASGLTDGHLTALEWVVAGIAGVASLGAVYGVTNAPRNNGTP